MNAGSSLNRECLNVDRRMASQRPKTVDVVTTVGAANHRLSDEFAESTRDRPARTRMFGIKTKPSRESERRHVKFLGFCGKNRRPRLLAVRLKSVQYNELVKDDTDELSPGPSQSRR